VIPYIHNCKEYFSFKAETIKWINSRLWNGDPGLSDTTLGSIMLLTDLEVSWSVPPYPELQANASPWPESLHH
jgi:hypothetical protein